MTGVFRADTNLPHVTQARTLGALIERAGDRAGRPGRTVLGIAGPPGSGKSTLASEIAAALPELTVVVGMDGFHLAQEELLRLGRADRKGAPDTFDDLGYAALLRRLREGGEPVVYAPQFRREIEQPIAGAVAIAATVPLVITEGNYLLLWPHVRALLDEVWYLDVDDDERRRRLVARRLGHGGTLQEAERCALGTDERNAEVVVATAGTADLRVRLQ